MVKMNPKKTSPLLAALIIFVFLAASLGLLGWYFFEYEERQVRKDTVDKLMAVANLKASQIQIWRKNLLADGGAVLSDKALAEKVKEYLGREPQDGNGDVHRWLLAWMESFFFQKGYYDVQLVDTDGRIRVSLRDKGRRLCETEMEDLKKAVEARKEILSDLHVDMEEDRQGRFLHIDMIVPVMQPGVKDGRVMAALVFKVNPDLFLYPLINSWPTQRETAETLLVRREGDEVVFLNSLRYFSNAALKLRFSVDMPLLPAARAARGETGEFEGMDYRGVPVISYIRRVPDTGWFLIAKIDRDEVFKDFHSKYIAIFSATLGLIGLSAVVLAFIFVRRESEHSRRRQEAEIQRTALEKHYDYLTKFANDIIFLTDIDGKILDVNERAVSTYGYTRAEFSKMNIRQIMAGSAESSEAVRLRRLQSPGGVIFENVHVRKDGGFFPVEVSARSIEIEGTQFVQEIIRDISQRKRAENQIININRMYILLSQVSKAVVHFHDIEELFRNICRISVEHGKFVMAWIGIVDKASGLVRPSAWAGAEEGFLSSVTMSVKDSPEGYGPVGTAFRERRCSFTNNIEKDGMMSLWRNDALRRGYQSAASVPIIVDDGPIGVLTVYSTDMDFFNTEEVELLEEIGESISFGLKLYDQEKQRKEAEESVRRQLDELIRWQNVTIDREFRILELKKEVNSLLAELGRGPKYSSPSEKQEKG